MGARKLLLVTMASMMFVAACNNAQSAGTSSRPSDSPAVSGSAFDAAAAEKYCTDQGGQLVDRVATANTNGDPSTWLHLAGRMRLCEFESTADGNTTRISVDLVTLYSQQPTLAGLAYLSKLPPPKTPTPSTNLAAYNCTNGLGGARNYGNALAAGGGWTDQAQPVFQVMVLCVFADMSGIDEWGITYYANGIVRGADLSTKMRYRSGGPLPPVFSPSR